MAGNSWLLDILNSFMPSVYTANDDSADIAKTLSATLIRVGRYSTQEQLQEIDHMVVDLEDVLSEAHRSMPLAKTGCELLELRQIYVDASILLALTVLRRSPTSDSAFVESHPEALQAVSLLDKAVVIAGRLEDRLDLILLLIKKIQTLYLPWSSPTWVSRYRTLPKESLPPPACVGVSRIVRTLDSPPSLSTFQRFLSHEPFVLKGFASAWQAIDQWPSPEYLFRTAGCGRIVPVEIGSDYRTDDWKQTLMPWEEFLQHIFAQSDLDSRVLYLAQHDLFAQFPSLRDDFEIPDYIYAVLGPPEYLPDYRPPGNEEQLVINCWFGRGGARSPAHTDPFFNFYAQVTGQKQVWLAPPSASPSMYPFPPTSRPSNPAENKVATPGMSNTSQVDVFDTAFDDFPDFTKHACPEASCVTLSPGDVLFFPPGWWHAMRVVGDEPSMSISFWF